MEKREEPRSEFRRLPPRVTPEEMVETQPLVRAVPRAEVGNDTEWEIRKAAG